MIEFEAWRRSQSFPDRPWLVLGKGPTYERRSQFDLTSYNLLSLNHVVAEQSVDIAHLIDIEVAEACGDALERNARFVLMPRHPHLDHLPTELALEALLPHVPALERLDRENRLICYDLAGATEPAPSDHVRVRYFSSEAALQLLASIGATTVRSLGVDGGRSYATSFAHLSDSTLLSNGQPSFSLQLPELRRIAREHEVDFEPLVPALRVFVGADRSQALAVQVLEDSIRRHTSEPVEVVAMTGLPGIQPKDPQNRARTAFSFDRFMIPALCDYRGQALYLDADMQVFSDISELWQLPFDGAAVLCTDQPEPPKQWRDNPAFTPGRQFSVMMLDCSALPWRIEDVIAGLDEGHYTYKQLMAELCIVDDALISARIPAEWNHLERHDDSTKLTHYTVVPTQPWKNNDNPLMHVWEDGFRAAVQRGSVDGALVHALVREGHVKSSLLDDVGPEPAEPSPRPAPSAAVAELRALRQSRERARATWARRARSSLRRRVEALRQ